MREGGAKRLRADQQEFESHGWTQSVQRVRAPGTTHRAVIRPPIRDGAERAHVDHRTAHCQRCCKRATIDAAAARRRRRDHLMRARPELDSGTLPLQKPAIMNEIFVSR
eukprot:SAG31_NODE_610_length_13564_cov_3.189528_10_plen_109_part_00